MSNKNILKQTFLVNKNQRVFRLKQKPKLLWFTGLSGSGKSTLSMNLEKLLFDKGYVTFCLDGDNVRLGLCNDLGFSSRDRSENIRRIAEVSKLMIDAGLVVLASFISPLSSDRDLVRKIVGDRQFIEIFLSTPLEKCEKRDVKGLYLKARKGELENFTGISSTYEVPKNPKIVIDTSKVSINKSINIIYEKIKTKISDS